jgi:hypothetical protein
MSFNSHLSNKYSTLKIDKPLNRKSVSASRSRGPKIDPEILTPRPKMERHIIRPIQFLFSPKSYLLGWLISGLVAFGALVLLASLAQTTPLSYVLLQRQTISFFVGSGFILFGSQWIIHMTQMAFHTRSLYNNQVFISASLLSQSIFMGLIDFCICLTLTSIFYISSMAIL